MRKAILYGAGFTTLLTLTIAAIPQPAQAQMICGLREDIGKMLDRRFAEQPKAAGLAGERIVELLVSQSGSWTILITSGDGQSCVVAGGDNWIDRPVQTAAKPKLDPGY